MNVFNISDYGAIGDGVHVNTEVIQNCIDECSSRGGKVVIDGGVFVAGTIFMKSNVTLEITASAVLLASPDIRDYAQNTHHHRYRNEPDLNLCWIYAEEQSNFKFTGRGRLDGNAQAFPSSFPTTCEVSRPMMFRFLRCHHIYMEDLKLYNAASWTTAFLDSNNIWIDRLDIYNDKNHNGDGLDFDGCADVFVSNCRIQGTDDNICLQSSSKAYPVNNIHIENCHLTSICAGIRIGLKSIGTISNVVISNCTMQNVWREGIKIECTEGGTISDITVDNIAMHNVRRPIFVILNNAFEPDGFGSSVELDEMPPIGSLQRLIFNNIIAADDEKMNQVHYRLGGDVMGEPKFNGIRFDAEEHHKIEQVSLSNIYYTSVGNVRLADIPAEYPAVLDRLAHPKEVSAHNYYPDWSRAGFMDVRNIDGLYLSNVQFKNLHEDERPPYIIENSRIVKNEIFL